MSTPTFDAAEHPRGDAGKFATKPVDEVDNIELPEPTVYSPAMSLHDTAYSVTRATESWSGLLKFADQVDAFLEEDLGPDMGDEDLTRLRYLHVEVDSTDFEMEAATITGLDAEGNELAESSRSGWTTWHGGVGGDYQVPDLPSEFVTIDSPLGQDQYDLSKVTIDLHKLRDFDWAAREKQFRDELRLALDPAGTTSP